MPLNLAVSAHARKTIKAAYDELDRAITPGDKRDFANTTLQHVRKAALDIENQLASRQSLRNMRRLMPFFQGLEHYSKVVDILCNGTPYLPWIWAPITLILRIACESVEAFEKIIKGYSSIAESLKRFEILSDAFIGDQEFQKTLAVFYADILEFHKHAYRFVRRNGWKLMFVASWGRFERKLNNILEDLDRHGSLIDQEANARDISEAKKMREDIRAWREESQSQLSREETEKSAKQCEAIASWLKVNGSDQLTIFDSISSEVSECQGTCGWILKNEKIRSWFQNKPDTPALWLQGSAGTGKSVLCTQLVDFMKASNMFVAYHFCSYSYACSTAYEQILKSLTLQLARKDDDLVAHVYKAHVLEKKLPTTTALEQLFQTLLAVMSNQPSQADHIWIVIDGLDECEPDKQTRLIRLINQVTSKPSLPGSTVCKVLISSRSPSNALQKLRRKQIISLAEEKSSLHGAIGQYVRERLRLLEARLRQLEIAQDEVEEIRAVIVEKADGMFLYARLVMDYLASNIFYSGDEMKQSVNQLPKKLADFYHKILTQILIQLDSRSVDRIRCILGWVAFAKRPLRKLEFLSAITFSPGDPEIDRLAPQYILDICGTLVEERRDSTLAFIHISVKEFLQSPSSNIVIRKQQALHEHGVATVTCLLSGLRVFGSEFPEQEKFLRVGKGLHAFHVYATEYWTDYLLSHATRTDGFNAASPSLLISLACQLADKVEGTSSGKPRERDSEMNQINERLTSLRQYPTLQKHVERALKARSLKNLEARILEGLGISNPSKPRAMADSISTLLVSYQQVVMSLLDHNHFPGLSGSELELFRAHFRTSALTCRLGSCPRATLGFETERLLSEHERSHVRCFPCTFPGCQNPPLPSAKALRSHTSKYHTPATARKAIRKTRFEPRQHSQQKSLDGVSTFTFASPELVARGKRASRMNPQPQQQGDPFPLRKATESDGDTQQQPKAIPRLPTSGRFPGVDTRPLSRRREPLEPDRNQSSITKSPEDPENQDLQMSDSTHEQDPQESSPLMNTEEGRSGAPMDEQDFPSQLQPVVGSAESIPFRSLITLRFEELVARGEIFRLYAASFTLGAQKVLGYQRLVAAAGFGYCEDVQSLIFDQKVSPEQTPLSSNLAAAEFSTPILAAIGGQNPEVLRLLVSHEDFDPSRLFAGATYTQTAERRRGPHWEEECQVLRNASMDYGQRHTSRPVGQAQLIIEPSETQPQPQQEVLAPKEEGSVLSATEASRYFDLDTIFPGAEDFHIINMPSEFG